MSYVYFYIGHLVSIIMNKFDCGWPNRFYNYCMLKSVDIQNKTGKGPWRKRKP